MAQNARVSVAIRLRPASTGCLAPEQTGGNVLTLRDPRLPDPVDREYPFDKVFWGDAPQEEVFESISKPLVEHVLDGYNGCCFAYGQTGSGKTYSMFGQAGEKRGIIPRAMEMLFDAVERKKPYMKVACFVSFLEIYMDEIHDLGKFALPSLSNASSSSGMGNSVDTRIEYAPPPQKDFNPQRPASGRPSSSSSNRPGSALNSNNIVNTARGSMTARVGSANSNGGGTNQPHLEIRENANGTVYVKDLSIIPVHNINDVMHIINTGVQHRATFETQMNAYSSRSHTIFTLTVVQSTRAGTGADASGDVISGMLNLVDLAGSERLKKSESEGQRMREAVVINKSLSALGNVILGLDSNDSYIHYRDSKLTRILQDSLGGNSYTTLMATIYPTADNFEECLATLQFANRCKNVRNQPRVNYVDLAQSGASESTVRKLQEEIAELKQQLEQLQENAQKEKNSLQRQMAVLGVKINEDGNIVAASSTAGGSGSVGGSLLRGGSFSLAGGVLAEREKDSLGKRLEEKKMALQKLTETMKTLTDKHRAETEQLKRKVVELEAELASLKHGAAAELENVKQYFTEEMRKLAARSVDGSTSSVSVSVSLDGPTPGSVLNRKSSVISMMQASNTTGSPSNVSGTVVLGSPTKNRGDLTLNTAILSPHGWPDASYPVVPDTSAKTVSEIKAMYDAFIAEASERVKRNDMVTKKVQLEAKDAVATVMEQRNALFQLSQVLLDIVESGKTFPKHTGGTGLKLTNETEGLVYLKRARQVLQEALDPLRPVIPRSNSPKRVPGPMSPTMSSPPPVLSSASGTGDSSGALLTLQLPLHLQQRSSARPSSAKPTSSRSLSLSVSDFSFSASNGLMDGEDIDKMDAPALRQLVHGLRRSMSSMSPHPMSSSMYSASSPAPALFRQFGHLSFRPEESAPVEVWKEYASSVEQERDALRASHNDQTKKLNALRISFESQKRSLEKAKP